MDNQINNLGKLKELYAQIEEPYANLVRLRGKKIDVEYIPTDYELVGYGGEDAIHFAMTIPLPDYDWTDDERESDNSSHLWGEEDGL